MERCRKSNRMPIVRVSVDKIGAPGPESIGTGLRRHFDIRAGASETKPNHEAGKSACKEQVAAPL